eukprot:113705-Prymnesium_polylepis.1
MELHTAPTASSAVRQPHKPVNTSDNAHKLLMVMHDKRSPERAALNLPATAARTRATSEQPARGCSAGTST